MNRSWILTAAVRHLRTRRREKGHVAFGLSAAGIAGGVLTLVVVLAVMNGFQLGTIEDILEVNSYHLRIEARENGSTPADAMPTEEITGWLRERPWVAAAVPFQDVQVLAGARVSNAEGMLLRGVPPEVRDIDPGFGEHVETAAGTFAPGAGNQVVLGAELARRMALLPGDRMTVLNLSGEQLDVRSPERTPLTVVGMFRTGYLDFDRNWGFVSLETARSLVGRGESPVIGIKLRNRFRDQAAQAAVASHLAERYGGGRFEVGSWRQYNRAIFGALRMEKTFLIVLIGLIFIVVGANIHQSLKRSVRERLEEIAVLKTLGARPREVQLVFVLEGIITGFVGATVGTLAGLALAVNIEGLFAAIEAVVNTGIGLSVALFGGGGAANVEIFSSQYFYLTEVPSEVIFLEVLGIYLFGWLSAAVAAYVASRSVVGVRPAQVLREE